MTMSTGKTFNTYDMGIIELFNIQDIYHLLGVKICLIFQELLKFLNKKQKLLNENLLYETFEFFLIRNIRFFKLICLKYLNGRIFI